MATEVGFDEFQRIDMRVGRVISSEPVPGSKRLVRLMVEVGGEKRQCVAGIGEQYDPKSMDGRTVAVVVNLKPRKIFGHESQVMLLAALDGDVISLLQPDKDVKPGSRIA